MSPHSESTTGSITHLSLSDAFSRIHEHWRPKLVGVLNGQAVKLAKFQGAFVWHTHAHEDEMFLVVRGRFWLEFRDRRLEVGAGEFVIVPRGVEHRPVAAEEVEVLLFEPLGTLNTGDALHESFTAPIDDPL